MIYSSNRNGLVLILLICMSATICGQAVSNIEGNLHSDYEADRKRADALFRQRQFKEALPLIEKLIAVKPNDDQAVFGLGVALIFTVIEQENPERRRQLVSRTQQALVKAKDIGIEDFFLERQLQELLSENEAARENAVEDFCVLWFMHPPMVFDSEPPSGIKLPEGYRHKTSTDFEGGTSGIIWKKDGPRIFYGFAYWASSGADVESIKKSKKVWQKELSSKGLKFVYALTKDNRLTISIYRQGHPYADFSARVKNQQDIEEVLSIVKGLEGRKTER